MYPGVIVEYNDQSDIPVTLPVTEVRNQPLFAAIFTADKGPEGWTRVSGEDFFNLYGNTISFARHGQPLLQAAMTINAGAELLCKRLVASDATLANLGIIVKIDDITENVQVQATDEAGKLLYVDAKGDQTTDATTDNVANKPIMVDKMIKVSAQATDKDGKPLYTDAEGNETTDATAEDGTANLPLMKETEVVETVVTGKTITYSVKSATAAKTVAEAKDEIIEGLSEGEKLLYVIADNGRGESKKRVKIVPNYKLSKNLSYTLYTLTVIEGTKEIESMTFSVNPDLIVSGENISLPSMINTHSTQLTCVAVDENIEYLAKTISETRGAINDTNIYQDDILFGCTNRGEAIAGVTLDETGKDLKASYGQILDGGVNGKLGAYPFSEDETVRNEYVAQAVSALTGDFDTVIFNVDQYMISAFVDANYPDDVKSAIADLARFREDFVYFRDMGLGKTDLSLVEECNNKYDPDKDKNMFCATYCQSYDVIDPYTKKQIPVTIGYDLAQKLVAHCNNGCILPTAGMKYNMTIDNAIYGTLSFAPTICPEENGFEGNQKEKLEDMHINYASYINNQLVIESLYTSQERNSQWSYINNVMGIQEVVKAIRTRCPAIRYTFIDGEDLERYKADVEEVIAPFQSNFKQLTLDFVSDATYSANKIFYAALKVVYNDFVQTEWFKVTALSAVETSEA